jgi:hypothetical protein
VLFAQLSRTYSNPLLNTASCALNVASANGDSEFTTPQTWRRPGWSMRDVVRSTHWNTGAVTLDGTGKRLAARWWRWW